MDYESVDSYVGNRIKVKRLLLGLSQTQLSKKLDISFQQLQKYEKGSNRVTAGKLYHLAVLLGEPVSFFFSGLSRNNLSSPPEMTPSVENSFRDIEMNKEVFEIVHAFMRVKDPGAKKQIKELLKAMADPKVTSLANIEN